jgi:hypothetical protein
MTVTGAGRHPGRMPTEPAAAVTVDDLRATLTAGLRDTRPRTLAGLRDTVAGILEAGGYQAERLPVLGPGDRADFLTGGGIAIDLADSSTPAAAVHRRVIRHARHHQVTAVIVVTARQTLLGILPGTADGKAVCCIHVKGSPR